MDGLGAGIMGWNYYGTGDGVKGLSLNGIGVHGNSQVIGGKFESASDGSPIGVYGYVSDIDGGGADYIAGKFEAAAGTNRYSLQLLDGTEGVNKVLVSKTSDGKTNWSSSLSGLTTVRSTTISGGTISGGTMVITTTPTTDNTNTQVLSRDPSTGIVELVDISSLNVAFNYGLANAIMTGNFLT